MDTTCASDDVGLQRGRLAWRLGQTLTVVALGCAVWWVLAFWPFHIDVEVYRMGGRAWLDGLPLYGDDALFPTTVGLGLPFTYPPLAAIVFAPFAWMSLSAATAVITVTALVLLIISLTLVLTGLDVWPTSAVAPEPAWVRRAWLAAAIVAPTVIVLEPIRSTFSLGQINVVLMALVIADCVPRRTPWPRGMLLGLAIALKLTPAVFLLYFLLRRDLRAVLTSVASFLAATLAGFALAWDDSWEYWTHTVRNTDRIGNATFNTNQNLAGLLARLGLGEQERATLWLVGSAVVLALTVYVARRALRVGESLLALICVALFGLVVSPVSWSHHWVWGLPALVVVSVLAYRYRSVALGVLGALGVVLLTGVPLLALLPENHEAEASWWRQLVGLSYVWWALALIVTAGMVVAGPTRRPVDQPATFSEIRSGSS